MDDQRERAAPPPVDDRDPGWLGLILGHMSQRTFGTPEARQVRFEARECRTGDKWEVLLPEVCFKCGGDFALKQQRYIRPVLYCEMPIGLIVGAAVLVAAALVGVAAFEFISWLLALGLGAAAIAGALGVAYVSMSREEVRAVAVACGAHVGELSVPQFVLHGNELVVTLPTESYAAAARTELTKKRRKGGGSSDEAEVMPTRRPVAKSAPRPSEASDERRETSREMAGDDIPMRPAAPKPTVPRPAVSGGASAPAGNAEDEAFKMLSRRKRPEELPRIKLDE